MARDFDPRSCGPVFADFLDDDRRRPLDAGSGAGEKASFEGLTVERAFAHTTVRDRDAARCCLAACWLLVDDLEASHRVSQSVATPAGSWWHGVMHRREGDFGNAKYWMRQADWPPALESLSDTHGGWDSVAFVDRCAAAIRSGDATEIDTCLDLQQSEWEALFAACYAAAVG